jgi:hypothetical protein
MSTLFYKRIEGNGGMSWSQVEPSDITNLLSGGKIDASLLPSYVDDVLVYSSTSGFPGTGTTGIIYIATDTNISYRWNGSSYTAITINLTDPTFTTMTAPTITSSTITSTGDIALNPSTTNTVNYCNFRAGGSGKYYLMTFTTAGSPACECGTVYSRSTNSYMMAVNSSNNLKINYSAVAGTSYNPSSETAYFGISSTGTISAEVGHININTIGKTLGIAAGTNGMCGTCILVGGTVTVANTSITANSRIFVSVHAAAGTAYGRLSTTRVVATSFTVNSQKADTTLETGDTSTIAYVIFEVL